MINFWHEGVTFLGAGKVRKEDLSNAVSLAPVSYTHLTLPTKDSV